MNSVFVLSVRQWVESSDRIRLPTDSLPFSDAKVTKADIPVGKDRESTRSGLEGWIMSQLRSPNGFSSVRVIVTNTTCTPISRASLARIVAKPGSGSRTRRTSPLDNLLNKTDDRR